MAKECTVRLSGDSFLISAAVYLTSSCVSPGSPRIISILMLSNPSSLARANASFTCSGECFLPMMRKVSSLIVCGLIDILVIPCFFNTRSFSTVILSARPASTVNSCTRPKSKYRYTAASSRSSSSGSKVVGVPPPI